MKIYTNTFDLAKASPHRFWVAPYSDFKIGVKILAKGEVVDKDFTVKAGAAELTPDEDKIDGFTLYTVKSGDSGFVEYTIEVEDIAEKLKLTQIVTDSTVFEVGGGGGGDVPADVATQTWVNSQISDFITEDYVDSAISDFITDDALTAYYTKSETSSAVEISTALAGKQPTGDYALASQIPTVNNATVTLTQDGTTVGSFTLNQSNDVSVDFAGGSGGGSAISAYALSDSPIQSETLIRQALVDNTCLPQTIVLNEDGTIEIFDVEGSLDLHSENPSFSSLIPNAVKVLVGTKVTSIANRCFMLADKCKEIILPNSVTSFTGGEIFTNTQLKRLVIPDSISAFTGYSSPFWNFNYYGDAIDFGNTRTTVIPADSDLATTAPNLKYIVPDALYSQWIATSPWSGQASRIFPHSTTGKGVGNAPYTAYIAAVYESDWETLSATADSNTLYTVLPDPE